MSKSEAKRCLDDFLETVEKCSVRNTEFNAMPPIDWAAYRQDVEAFYEQINPARPEDIIPVVRHALRQLGDGHSHIPNQNYTGANSQMSEAPKPSGRMIGKMAYIRLPECLKDESAYAQTTQDLIAVLDQHDPAGWIVDLRINTGGTCWPMIVGIGPLIGDGTHFNFIYPNNFIIPCHYKNGKAYCREESTLCSVEKPYTLKKEKPPIAVLSGDHTASSGEVTLIAFLKLPNVRTFGEDSGGISSSNKPFTLFGDVQYVLTIANLADREMTPYGSKISPDFSFAAGMKADQIQLEHYEPSTDPLVLHASEWLHREASLRPSLLRSSANTPPSVFKDVRLDMK